MPIKEINIDIVICVAMVEKNPFEWNCSFFVSYESKKSDHAVACYTIGNSHM